MCNTAYIIQDALYIEPMRRRVSFGSTKFKWVLTISLTRHYRQLCIKQSVDFSLHVEADLCANQALYVRLQNHGAEVQNVTGRKKKTKFGQRL